MINFIVLIGFILLTPLSADAQQVMPTFQQLPFWDGAGSASFIEALYKLAISAAAILAVLRLIWAGVQYMLSEIVTSKQKAVEDIKSALLGLLIVLGAVTILNTINPRLTNLDVIGNGPTINLSNGSNTQFRVNIRPGDMLDDNQISANCPGTLIGQRRGTNCYEESMDYYRRSCIANGGQRFERKIENSWFDRVFHSGGLTRYQCITN